MGNPCTQSKKGGFVVLIVWDFLSLAVDISIAIISSHRELSPTTKKYSEIVQALQADQYTNVVTATLGVTVQAE